MVKSWALARTSKLRRITKPENMLLLCAALATIAAFANTAILLYRLFR